MFLTAARDVLAQGDILEGLSVVELHEGAPRERVIRAALLSHTCEFQPGQKVRNLHTLVVEVRAPEDAAEGGLWHAIREGRGWSAFYVADCPHIGECWIDFARVYRVERSHLYAALGAGRRIACMDQDGQELLVYRFLSYLLHEHLKGPPAAASEETAQS